MALSIIFTTYNRNGLKKLQYEWTFKLVLKKDKCVSVENILLLNLTKPF